MIPEQSPSPMLEQARSLAASAHAGQRYGSRPYTTHLEDVVSLLAPYGEVAQTLGYLHDILEDTDVHVAALRDAFGPFITECVSVLTDEAGRDRKVRKARTYAKMAHVKGDLTIALVVKAADRLANVTACIVDGRQDKLDTYVAEHDAFRAAVYRDGLCEDLWARLDRAINANRKPASAQGEG